MISLHNKLKNKWQKKWKHMLERLHAYVGTHKIFFFLSYLLCAMIFVLLYACYWNNFIEKINNKKNHVLCSAQSNTCVLNRKYEKHYVFMLTYVWQIKVSISELTELIFCLCCICIIQQQYNTHSEFLRQKSKMKN